MTEQRAVLLEIFRSEKCMGKHRSADEIFSMARELRPGISRATVYNNLKSMEAEGLIRRITGDFGCDYYDATGYLHGHLICTECHSIKDIDTPELFDTLKALVGESIDAYELKIRYKCPACRQVK